VNLIASLTLVLFLARILKSISFLIAIKSMITLLQGKNLIFLSAFTYPAVGYGIRDGFFFDISQFLTKTFISFWKISFEKTLGCFFYEFKNFVKFIFSNDSI